MAKKIVVMDGQETFRELVGRLRQEGYEVSICACDAEAFKCIKDVGPDVVVLDFAKLGAVGLSLVPVIKTDPVLSVTPLIVCTTPAPEVQQLLEQLAKMRLYVLPAPCGVEEIEAKVKEALEES